MTDQAPPSETSPIDISPVATSLYVHIPWCVRKCPYCDFNSHQAGDIIDEQRYISALLRDLDSEVVIAGKREIQSIFFGGGTPSLFSPEAIGQILEAIADRFTIHNNAEITMEANPGTFEQNNFAEFRAAGINRLSIGIQSFDNERLSDIGRIHDGQQSQSAISAAHQAGFNNINLDLMFGLPGQSIQQAVKDVEIACDQNVQHISHYQLTIEPNTYFHKHPPQTPDTETSWEMQHQCHEVLSSSNFQQYEVSAFSKANAQCKHNLNYWMFGDYIGIGAGAHGKLSCDKGITRRWKHRQPEHYMSETSDALSGQSIIESKEVIFEFLLNALRLRKGFTFETFEKNTGCDRKMIIEACEKVEPELLQYSTESIRTSEKGYLFLNDVLQQFI